MYIYIYIVVSGQSMAHSVGNANRTPCTRFGVFIAPVHQNMTRPAYSISQTSSKVIYVSHSLTECYFGAFMCLTLNTLSVRSSRTL